jgi:hypothetical protein
MIESTETIESVSRPGVSITLQRVGLAMRNRIILKVADLRSKHRGLMTEWKSAGGDVNEKGMLFIPESLTDEAKRSALFDIQERMAIAGDELGMETAKQIVVEVRNGTPEAVPLADIFEHDPDPTLAYEIVNLCDERLTLRPERQKNLQAPSTSSEAEAPNSTSTSADTASASDSTQCAAA